MFIQSPDVPERMATVVGGVESRQLATDDAAFRFIFWAITRGTLSAGKNYYYVTVHRFCRLLPRSGISVYDKVQKCLPRLQ